MSERYAVVVTTIHQPTSAVRRIAAEAPRLGAEFILIGDSKSPADFSQPGATYLDLDAQRRTGLRYAELAPIGHYARKNIGYLAAMRNGVDVIIETDDDNIPGDDFWAPRKARLEAKLAESGWINTYARFADGLIWPRGLPLEEVRRAPTDFEALPSAVVDCPIQQGLADEDPDVDAIYRLLLPLPVRFRRAGSVALRGAWCPFNSQNTTWWRKAFPLLYLPAHCSWRVTDIWRSFVAQRIAYLNGWGVLFHQATVHQERNEHDLMRDFAEEVPGYLHNTRIRRALEALHLPAGEGDIPEAMRACYEELVRMGLIGTAELPLLDAWLQDLSAAQAGAPAPSGGR
ncbi:MAG: DUF288 domain-containing protein [Proteobacteria bacterium]|nr:DUF288 domain-containing protein [Pseudomonadota bacterium]